MSTLSILQDIGRLYCISSAAWAIILKIKRHATLSSFVCWQYQLEIGGKVPGGLVYILNIILHTDFGSMGGLHCTSKKCSITQVNTMKSNETKDPYFAPIFQRFLLNVEYY